MTKVVKFKLNLAGVRKLLKGSEMQSLLAARAGEIAQRCGSGYESRTGMAETRALATVYPSTAEARRDAHKNNTLEKALG